MHKRECMHASSDSDTCACMDAVYDTALYCTVLFCTVLCCRVL